jgi:perosamine synthetase
MAIINLNRSCLAINGGKKLRIEKWKDNITVGVEERLAVMRVLDHGYLSLFEGSHTPDKPFSFKGGPEVQSLEHEWSEYYGSKYSIAMNSATSGLYAAIGALGIGYGDEVIVSPYTMSACALAPMIYGAIPVFADVDPETGCLDPNSVEKKITQRTKGILVVHQFGFPAEMEKIMSLAKSHKIHVIEDCAQAHGAKRKGKYVGTIGDIGVFSLNVNKTIHSGEGGVCITNNEELAYRLQLIRNHGEAVVGPANYENIENIAGFNYRMTEITAAVAREQLKKLPNLNKQRLELVEQLKLGLKHYDFLRPFSDSSSCKSCNCSNKSKCESTYYVFPMKYHAELAGYDRSAFVAAANAEGAQFFEGYTKPLYLQPIYQQRILFKMGYPFNAKENRQCYMDYSKGICANAEKLHFEQVVINEHVRPPNSSKDVNDLIHIVEKICNKIL